MKQSLWSKRGGLQRGEMRMAYRTMATSLFVSAAGSRQCQVLGMWWQWHGFRLGSPPLMACCKELTVLFKPPFATSSSAGPYIS